MVCGTSTSPSSCPRSQRSIRRTQDTTEDLKRCRVASPYAPGFPLWDSPGAGSLALLGAMLSFLTLAPKVLVFTKSLLGRSQSFLGTGIPMFCSPSVLTTVSATPSSALLVKALLWSRSGSGRSSVTRRSQGETVSLAILKLQSLLGKTHELRSLLGETLKLRSLLGRIPVWTTTWTPSFLPKVAAEIYTQVPQIEFRQLQQVFRMRSEVAHPGLAT